MPQATEVVIPFFKNEKGLHKPYVWVAVKKTASESLRTQAIIDTGADHTHLGRAYAEALGLHATGKTMKVWTATTTDHTKQVRIVYRLLDDNKKPLFPPDPMWMQADAYVTDTDTYAIALGMQGFVDSFESVTFEYPKHVVLRPQTSAVDTASSSVLVLPFRHLESGTHKPMIRIAVEKSPTESLVAWATIDTGADYTMIGNRFAAELRLPVGDRTMKVVGVKSAIEARETTITYRILNNDNKAVDLLPIRTVAYVGGNQNDLILGMRGFFDAFESVTFEYPKRIILRAPTP